MKLTRILTGAILLLSLTCGAIAQNQPQQQSEVQMLPIDPAVRMGKLPNGLTYFIRHNEKPKDRAEFYIAQRVGSILELDAQSGLAHFLEHMAFNGTKNFPGKNLISYLESIGVKFGENLNAYTGFDETVYTIMGAPTVRKGVIDSCLLILHDWSNNIALEDKEIDNERGVIHEEWRSRNSANQRMIEEVFRKVFPGNRYGDRMPIGSMDVVDHFKYKELRDYYKKWYRPDLQGLIIVGDVDVDYVENKIKEIFKDVPAPVNPATREYIKVADNKEPIVAIATDPEATSTNLSVVFKTDPLSREIKGSIYGLLENYMKSVVSQMIAERFAEIVRKPNAPFLQASATMGNYMWVCTTKDAISFDATAKEGQYKTALKALVAEIERIRQHGFTASEYDRARKNLLKGIEDAYKDRNNNESNNYAEDYKEYFTQGGVIPGIEMEYNLYNSIAPNIKVSDINSNMKTLLGDENMVIILTGPKKDSIKYPTEKELSDMVIAERKNKVEAYKETLSEEKLLDKQPVAGKVISEKKDQKYGTTEWILSNGAKVYLKKTDFKENEIMLNGTAPGGSLLFPESDYYNLKVFNSVINLGGLGKFDVNQLGKVLTGRTAVASTSLGNLTEDVSGASSKDDVETMLQLLYLNFTDKRIDKEAFEAFRQKTIEKLKNQEQNPMSSLGDSISKAMFGNNQLTMPLKESDFKNISYDRIMKMYQERFANAGDFMFFIVGSFDEATLKPLIERYIASLPSTKKVDKPAYAKVPVIRFTPYKNEYTKNLDTPMAIVFDCLTAKSVFNQNNLFRMSILTAILDQVYTATIRESEGGSYGVSTEGNISEYPENRAALQVAFQCAPEKADYLNKIVYRELEKIAKEGPSKEHFEKAILNMEKKHAESLRENSYWLSQMGSFFYKGRDYYTNWDRELKAITPNDIKAFVADILKQNVKIEVVMKSSKTEADKKAITK
ncbi:M16 family metallopeptidase [Porphyromonas pogonae]|uniref:M16 family metallopeptidase n=1 Tax=Porphyromonas pogonae TaxID=867595 RepID=UPI002E792C32|nr:insulinase family protein [Porphyromonas pogonae]